ncbi:hypothetical protein [Mycolicibacterium sp.]|uniref:hypothetical protein n=1 Tax=Mycolicibacterium sp. TaxID=2320850 RepID=UPI0037CB2AD7
MTQTLLPAVQRYVDAVNAFDTDAIMATFTSDAVVNDANSPVRNRFARGWRPRSSETA